MAVCLGNKKEPLPGRFFFRLVFGDEAFFFFGGFFIFFLLFVVEIAGIKFAVVHPVGAEFFNENFDAAGDWDGNDSAGKAEGVNTNSYGRKNDEGWKFHAFALDFWRDNIRFDLEINDSVDKEGDAGPESIETKEQRDYSATNKASEHWNKTEDASNEAEWESKARGDLGAKANNEDRDGCGTCVNETNRDGARDVFRDSVSEAANDVLGATSGFGFAH